MKNLFIALTMLAAANAMAEGGGSSVGPGNPAALNCIKLGGGLERFRTPQGEDSNCVIEEWQLYREMHARKLDKRHRYGPGGVPNPAAVNCADIGGTIRIVNAPEGEAGYCVVEQWDLFRAIDVITKP